MKKRSLINDVSISEMREMRERGMTNAEIAQSLGCSYDTVRKYLGKAPFHKAWGEASRPVKAHEEKEPEVTYGCLKVLHTIATLEGAVCKYVVNTETGMVEIKEGLLTGVLDRSIIQDIIDELLDVKKMLCAK